MLGLLGTSLIGIDHLTGPISENEVKKARLQRHQLLRGKPAIQDLGNDAGARKLSFFFDETFCNPEKELGKINEAFQRRTPMKLYFDVAGLELGIFLIDQLSIDRQKTTSKGKLVRVKLDTNLIEQGLPLGGVLSVPGIINRAINNPFLRRG